VSTLARLCRSIVNETEGGLSCRVYLLSRQDPGEEEGQEAVLLASHARGEHDEGQDQAFVELALRVLGPEGQRRMPGARGQGEAELLVASGRWSFARLIPSKGAVLVLVCRSGESASLGWAAVNAAVARLLPAL
jgi:hypothetical protein